MLTPSGLVHTSHKTVSDKLRLQGEPEKVSLIIIAITSSTANRFS